MVKSVLKENNAFIFSKGESILTILCSALLCYNREVQKALHRLEPSYSEDVLKGLEGVGLSCEQSLKL